MDPLLKKEAILMLNCLIGESDKGESECHLIYGKLGHEGDMYRFDEYSSAPTDTYHCPKNKVKYLTTHTANFNADLFSVILRRSKIHYVAKSGGLTAATRWPSIKVIFKKIRSNKTPN